MQQLKYKVTIKLTTKLITCTLTYPHFIESVTNLCKQHLQQKPALCVAYQVQLIHHHHRQPTLPPLIQQLVDQHIGFLKRAHCYINVVCKQCTFCDSAATTITHSMI